MAALMVVLMLCALTTSMILESKSDPLPLLDSMKAPLVADLDMTRVKSHIKRMIENELSNLTQDVWNSIQRMVDDGVQKKLAEMETRMTTFDTKLKSGKKNIIFNFS